LEMIAKRAGRLLKGGEPCLRSAAIMLINDFQRGRLPHYVAPPELKEDEDKSATESRAKLEGVEEVKQDLDAVGEEKMQTGASGDEEETESNELGKPDHDEQASSDDDDDDDDDEEEEVPAASIAEGDWDDEEE